MRIELETSTRRPWWAKIVLGVIHRYVGIVPGPLYFMTYDLAQIPRDMMKYMQRGSATRGLFTKGERELFAAYVSKLNACHF